MVTWTDGHDEPEPQEQTLPPLETLGLWRSRMHPDGTITWTTQATTVTVKPEPLPGYGHAEGHQATRRGKGRPGTPAA